METQVVKKLPSNPVNNFIYEISTTNTSYLTHNFFKYPAKFIPQIPSWAIENYTSVGDFIIDPFAGSGTSLVEGLLLQRKAHGIEIDKFGQLLSLVKTTPLDKSDVIFMREQLKQIKSDLKKIDKYSIPEINNLYHWFSEENVIKMGQIKSCIDHVNNTKIKKLMLVTFASIIRKCSFADEVSPKPYISKKHPKKPTDDVHRLYIEKLTEYFNRLCLLSDQLNHNPYLPRFIGDDARTIKKTNIRYKLAITSPPYINAFDYVRVLRLENLWLALESEKSLLSNKASQIGTEAIKCASDFKLTFKNAYLEKLIDDISIKDRLRSIVVAKYFNDMHMNMKQIFNLLENNGRYVIVVGDSKIRNVEVETHTILSNIGRQIGFSLEKVFAYRIKNRYLRIPRKGNGGFIKDDWIIVLKKT